MEAVVSWLTTAAHRPQPVSFWNTKVTGLSKHGDAAWAVEGCVRSTADVTNSKHLGDFDAVVLADQGLLRQGSAGEAVIQASGKVLK
jgi:hypothetical protein